VRTLLAIGLAACLFACVDFYLQLPAPAGFGSQFVWLDSGVFRRAQGLFYEASTLGNFCAFLLAVLPAALLTRPADRPAPVWLLSAICLPAVAALVFSYSRASLVNVAVIGLAFLALRRGRVRLRTLLAPALAMASAAAIGSWLFPAFFAHYWTRLGVVFEFFTTSPDRVLSGRLASWRAVADFLWSHPWLAAFGIGYKTLPYTNYLPGGVVADNTYLSLLAETGLLGLSVFLLLNAAILRTAWHAARHSNGRAVFFGSWIFCFWCGELVQMLSGDLITYWRVLPVYLCVLGLAAREAEA
jgi:O-antigen ligase